MKKFIEAHITLGLVLILFLALSVTGNATTTWPNTLNKISPKSNANPTITFSPSPAVSGSSVT